MTSEVVQIPSDVIHCSEKVLEYLDEKLSPGQIVCNNAYVKASSFMPRYEIGKIGGGKIVWFRVQNVPQQYWDEVVHPGLKHIADRLDRGIGFAAQVT